MAASVAPPAPFGHPSYESALGALANLAVDDIEWIHYTFDIANSLPGNLMIPEAPSASCDDDASQVEGFATGRAQHGAEPKGAQSPETAPMLQVGLKIEPKAERKRSVDSFDDVAMEPELFGDAPGPNPGQEAKRRRTMPEASSTFEEGRWQPSEISMLLQVAHRFVSEDLKVIGDIAFFCGVNRPRRAIDKQLKRMLKYDRWVRRDKTAMARQIAILLDSGRFVGLSAEQLTRLRVAQRIW